MQQQVQWFYFKRNQTQKHLYETNNFCSCHRKFDDGFLTKRSADNSVAAMLAGRWRMIAVTDNSSGVTITKPSTVQGDVDITFTANNDTSGTFYGNTPVNEISQSVYSIKTNQQLTIPYLDMTKVGETSWGKEFVDNICNAREYSFETNGYLDIKTISKTLTFQSR